MEGRRFALRILYAVVFSFVLWSIIWFLVVGVEGERSFEIVHVTRPFTGLPGFLCLAFNSAVFSVATSAVMGLILPDAMEERGWLHPAAWAISGAILGELTVWVVGILLFVLAKVTGMRTMLDATLINWVLWAAVALPYGAVQSILIRRKTSLGQNQPQSP